VAIADVAAINLTMWVVPYAAGVRGRRSAQLTGNTTQTGFQWDDNEFEVNQFGHPYQGGLHFSPRASTG
jgi:hypothetical protein